MRLLRIGEVAERLALGKSTVYQLTQHGELPSVVIGTAVRVPESALDEWIAQRMRQQRSASPAA